MLRHGGKQDAVARSAVATGSRRPSGAGPDVASATRVNLRPIASPLALGFGGLAIGTFLLGALQLGWVPISETSSVALVLLLAVAPAQGLASVLGFLARDNVAGTGMGVLAGTWAALGSILLTTTPGSTGHVPGLLLLMAAGLMLIPAAGAAINKLVPALVLATAALRFAVSGIWELTGSDTWKAVAGVVGLALAAIAWYAAAAASLEDVVKHPVLPLGRRGRGATATTAGMADQELNLAHEPGVRQQL